MTQNQRVLRALERHHSRGICSVDFMLPNVLDGGAPITRLAARIRDLKDQGHEIVEAGEFCGTRLYRLAQAPRRAQVIPVGKREPTAPTTAASPAPSQPSEPAPSLFELVPEPRPAIFDDEAA